MKSFVTLEPLEQRQLLHGADPALLSGGLVPAEPSQTWNVSGYRTGGGYGWQYDFDMTLVPDSMVQLDVRVRLTGTATTALKRTQWETGTESIWSYNFAVRDGEQTLPIVMNLDFVTSDSHHSVTVKSGTGRSNMTTWYQTDDAQTAAHEVGHMFGRYDEYVGGGIDDANPIYDNNSIMGGGEAVETRHFEEVVTWLESRAGRDMTLEPYNAVPTMGSLSASAGTVLKGQPLTLTASGVTARGAGVWFVSFYRDADGDNLINSDVDEYLGGDLAEGDGWSADFTTDTFDNGVNTLLAEVVDDNTRVSAAGVAHVTVLDPSTDVEEPTAALSAGVLRAAGRSPFTFTVIYRDDLAVNAGTIDGYDVRVVGPNGFNRRTHLIALDSTDAGTPRTAMYKITPPGDTWDYTDNGRYSVVMQSSQVTDLKSQPVASGVVGRFTVAIPTPRATISGTVYNDLNGNGRRTSNEARLAGWQVFIDTDNDGVWEPGEKTVLSDAKGNYAFSGLQAGTYVVRLVVKSGWRPTAPLHAARTAHLLAGVDLTARLFGVKRS